MRSLFEARVVTELKDRVARLRADTAPRWGRMTPAQATAHLAESFGMASGELRLPRVFIGRVLGPVIKRLALGNETPFRRNSPTMPHLVVADERQLDAERGRLLDAIDRFAAAGPAGCTAHPHPFFGRLTPNEWSELMYKHLDHHLRQFGV